MVYSQAYMVMLGVALLVVDRVLPSRPNKPLLPLTLWGIALILVGIGLPLVSEKVAIPVTISIMMSAVAPFVGGKLQIILEVLSIAIFGFVIFRFYRVL